MGDHRQEFPLHGLGPSLPGDILEKQYALFLGTFPAGESAGEAKADMSIGAVIRVGGLDLHLAAVGSPLHGGAQLLGHRRAVAQGLQRAANRLV